MPVRGVSNPAPNRFFNPPSGVRPLVPKPVPSSQLVSQQFNQTTPQITHSSTPQSNSPTLISASPVTIPSVSRPPPPYQNSGSSTRTSTASTGGPRFLNPRQRSPSASVRVNLPPPPKPKTTSTSNCASHVIPPFV